MCSTESQSNRTDVKCDDSESLPAYLDAGILDMTAQPFRTEALQCGRDAVLYRNRIDRDVYYRSVTNGGPLVRDCKFSTTTTADLRL